MVRFAEAATRGSDDLPDARESLQTAVGASAYIFAAAVIGIFNGLVRTADSTGIPLDSGVASVSDDFRRELGFNAFSGSKNTDLDKTREPPATTSVANLFGD